MYNIFQNSRLLAFHIQVMEDDTFEDAMGESNNGMA